MPTTQSVRRAENLRKTIQVTLEKNLEDENKKETLVLSLVAKNFGKTLKNPNSLSHLDMRTMYKDLYLWMLRTFPSRVRVQVVSLERRQLDIYVKHL